VYAKPGCPPCDATIRLLEKIGVAYVKLDVTTDTEAFEACKLMGYGSTPVVVAGDQHWSGFRPDRLTALAA
jgi:glutaredoxin-like protein NrdH